MSAYDWARRWVGLAVLVCVFSCSAVFVRGPERAHDGILVAGDCTPSRKWPVMDFVWASILGVTALGLATVTDDAQRVPNDQLVGASIYAGVSALFAAAGIHGLETVSACREAPRENALSELPFTDID